MSSSVPYGFDAKRPARPSPSAGADGAEADAANLDAAKVVIGGGDGDPAYDDRVERHWTEADRLAFLARAQRVNWR